MLDEGLVDLYGSEETVRFCQDFLDLFHLRDENIKTKIHFVPVKHSQNFKLSPSLEFSSLKVPHDSSSLAFFFYFKGERKELIYSGDTPAHPFLFKEAWGKDYLIHDCSAPSRFFKMYPSLDKMHTNSLTLGRHSRHAEVKSLVPCHFFGELEFSLSEIEKEIRENYEGKLIIPSDFMKITL